MTTIRPRFIFWGVLQGLLILLAFYGVARFFDWDLGIGLGQDIVKLPDGEPIDFSPAVDLPRLPAMEPGLRPRNVVFFLGDGMGFSQVLAARFVLQGAHQPLLFERFPVVSPMTTFSASAVYTDSAAGATALATGFKTDPGALSVNPSGDELRSLFEAASDRGLATGIVTDSYLWDASPSAFAVHNPSRRAYSELVTRLAATGIDWMVGGEDDRYDALKAFQSQDRSVSSDWETLGGADGPVLGLFPAEVIADPEQSPSLPDLTERTLDFLNRNPEGFFAFIETEDPDTGSHRQDLDQVVRGVGQLNESVRRALRWADSQANPSAESDSLAAETMDSSRAGTLILVTADHETSGLSIVGGSAEAPLSVIWATDNHTAAPVPLYAWGPGAERFSGALDNTEIANILADLLDLDLVLAKETEISPDSPTGSLPDPHEDAVP